MARIRFVLSLDGVLADRVGAPAGSLVAYLLATALVAAATAMCTALSPWLVGAQLIAFFPAVGLATLFFGAGAGLLAAALSTSAVAYVQSPGGVSQQEVFSLILFGAVALMDVGIISALLAANAAAHDSEARFRDTLESAPDASLIVDGRGLITLVNAQAEALFGYGRTAMIGQSVELLMPSRFRRQHANNVAQFRGRPQPRRMGEGMELRGLRQNGSEFPIDVKLSPLRKGVEPLVYCVIRDVTAQKVADERHELLVHELNHRVKNVLATVQAVAAQTLTTSSAPDDFRVAFSARLAALSRCHDVLTRSDWSGANVRDLVDEQLRPYDSEKGGRFVLTGPDTELTASAALALGMALGELATNAAKYGALSIEAGVVEVTWAHRVEVGEHWLTLTWRERQGPPVSPPGGRGFGTRLIERGLVRGLGGSARLTFDPKGVVCEIEFPLDRGVG